MRAAAAVKKTRRGLTRRQPLLGNTYDVMSTLFQLNETFFRGGRFFCIARRLGGSDGGRLITANHTARHTRCVCLPPTHDELDDDDDGDDDAEPTIKKLYEDDALGRHTSI